VVALQGKTIETFANDLAYPSGNSKGQAQMLPHTPWRQSSFPIQNSNHLSQKQRVSLGLGVQSFHQHLRGLEAGHHLDETSGILIAEPSPDQALELALARQFSEDFKKGIIARQFRVPVGCHQQQPTFTEVLSRKHLQS